ncbi:hypothetical protein MycrhDRAFT_3964 [Mycolicibacterium rhodesiae JS60]|nr:hypothetical protein MycrhDRAFT_3964 [Mycolicibacterium rhodesiae JS60]
MAGTGLEVLQGGGDNHGDRKTVVLTEFRIAQPLAHQLRQRIMQALAVAAQIVGSRGGEFGEHGIQLGPQLRGGHHFPHTHPVRALPAGPQEATLASAVLLGKLPVGVEVGGQPIGHLLQLIGPHRLGMPGQGPFGLVHLDRPDMIGQLPEELLDDPHMLTIQVASIPGLPRLGQQRCQRLTGQRHARRELFGIPDPAFGRVAADPQHISQHERNRRTPLIPLQMSDLGMRDRDQAAHRAFQSAQGREPLRGRQLLDIGGSHEFNRGIQRIQRHIDRTHPSNTSANHRQESPSTGGPADWLVGLR